MPGDDRHRRSLRVMERLTSGKLQAIQNPGENQLAAVRLLREKLAADMVSGDDVALCKRLLEECDLDPVIRLGERLEEYKKLIEE